MYALKLLDKLANVFRYVIIVWLIAIAYTFYGIYFISNCPYPVTESYKDLYRSICIEPLFPKAARINISLYTFPRYYESDISEILVDFQEQMIPPNFEVEIIIL